MTTAAMNNLWNYIEGLNLSARNRNWLAARLSVPTPKKARKAQLYDPETGEYLNDETMKCIEESREGKNIAFRGTLEEFHKWVESL